MNIEITLFIYLFFEGGPHRRGERSGLGDESGADGTGGHQEDRADDGAAPCASLRSSEADFVFCGQRGCGVL